VHGEGPGVATSLAADTADDVRVAGMATLDTHLDQLGDARIERSEGVGLDDLLVEVQRHERSLDVITGEAKAGLREVVGTKREEVGVTGDVLGHDGRARELDHGADGDVKLDALLLGDGPDVLLDDGAHDLDLGLEADERDHDLGLGIKALLDEVSGGASDSLHLHDVEFGVDKSETAATKAEHRVCLLEGVELCHEGTLGSDVLAGGLVLGDLDVELARVVEELVQRGIKETDDDGLAVHGLEHAKEIALLGGTELLERLGLDGILLSEDEVLDELLALAQEHVLGTIETNALGTLVGGELRVIGVVCVGTNADHATARLIETNLVSPSEDGLEIAAELGTDEGDLAQNDVTGGAVNGDDVTLVKHDVGTGDGAGLVDGIDGKGVDATDAGSAHATGDDGRVGRLAAVGREDALGSHHALEVIRSRLPTYQDAGLAGVLEDLGVIRGEDDTTDGGTRRCVEALGKDLVLCRGVELRVEKLVELVGSNAHDGLLLGDATLLVHLDGDLERGERGALADAGLQHPELALLDGELEVHHVGIVILEDLEDVIELLASLFETGGLGELGDGRRVTNARNDVLALGVDQEVTVALVGAIGRVAREGDAGGGCVTLVAEGHDLDVHSGAEVIGNLVLLAIENCPLRVPRTKDGLLGKTELKDRVGREDGLATLLDLGILLDIDVVAEDLLEPGDEVLEVIRIKVGIELYALLGLLGVDDVLEELAGDTHDDVREHLDETTIGIVGKAGVAGLLDESLNGVVVETEVKDGVHHSWHGEGRTRANGDEQWVVLVAELLAHALLEILAVLVDLVEDAIRPDVAGAGVGDAGLATDRESWRNGKADVGHLRQVGTLATGNPLGLVDSCVRDLGHVVAIDILAKAENVLLCHVAPLQLSPDTSADVHIQRKRDTHGFHTHEQLHIISIPLGKPVGKMRFWGVPQGVYEKRGNCHAAASPPRTSLVARAA